ncbi:MAG TPA: carotenoid oxygenase family protein [Thermoanaerobaculia bacterium]|nr:carotenoid oxygenase family protein [Thermoanaerobaculia bacterium]
MREVGSATAAPAREDLAPGLERAFSFLPEERSYRLREIAGAVPAFVRGTCYWNGPARFARGGLRYRHWLDGDGMVCALRFGDDGIDFTNRFVRSAKWTAEEEAERPVFRAFGTAFPGDRLVRGIALESPVNVSVYPFRGTLLACGEQGLPWELDPRTLATRGTFTFGGALNALSPFSAHAKIDPGNGELLNFGISYASAQPCLNVYRFSPSGALLARRRVPLPYPASLHDFCASTGHLIFFISPYLLDLRSLAGGRTLMDSLSWQPELGSRLLVVSRDSGEVVASVPAGSGYCLHTIHASEDGDRLTVDLLELDRPVYDQYQEMPDLFTAVGEGRPVRLVVDLRGGRLAARHEIDYQLAPDFPAIDLYRLHRAELPYRDFWMLGISAAGRPGRKFFDQLVHVDWSAPGSLDLWQAPAGHYLAGEPLMVADPAAPADARGGALLCPLFDSAARASRVLVFDALDVAAGPRATLYLEAPVPPSFHSSFAAPTQ